MKKLPILMIAALGALNFACMVDRPYDTPPDENMYEINYLSFSNNTQDGIDVVDGMLLGDIGPIRNINNSATVGGFHDDGYTSLEVVMTSTKGSAMVLLSIYGGVNHEDLIPESVHQFTPSTESRNGLSIESIVCSGNGAAGNWDYDDISNLVEVEVEQTEDPQVRRLNFTTYTEEDVATGHVDIWME
jgi:hypothetical protein